MERTGEGFRSHRGLDALTMHHAAKAWVESQNKQAAIQVVAQATGRSDARKVLLRAFRKYGWISPRDRRKMSNTDQEQEIKRLRPYAERSPNMRYIGDIDPRLVWEAAFRYYLDYQSFRQLASWMQGYMPRENLQSLSESLRRIWHINKWPVREREEAFHLRRQINNQ